MTAMRGSNASSMGLATISARWGNSLRVGNLLFWDNINKSDDFTSS